jgi:hypothetical protein
MQGKQYGHDTHVNVPPFTGIMNIQCTVKDIPLYNLCGIGSQHSNISKGKGGWGYIYKSLVCKIPIVTSLVLVEA